ncbi:MAG: hypothetical protein NTX59_04315 [Elusimicrobia bacterium]|nr:hypothetical protein [Elusimicrobiota bacterium]
MKIKIFFLLFMTLPCCGYCAESWTPLKLQLYGEAALPDADRVMGISLNFFGYSDSIYGLQAGFYNSAGNIHGIQIGLINICKGTLKGVQLGFANIGGRNAVLPVTIGINIGF